MRNNLNPRYDATEFGKLDFYKQSSVYKEVLTRSSKHFRILRICEFFL